MEPQIIDYYNEMPFMVNIIDKMNEELNEEQKKIKDLKSEIEHKNDIIFDLFFNHNIDIEVQEYLKQKIYNEDNDIFICKECKRYVYEPWGGGDTLKYDLYLELKEEEDKDKDKGNRLCCEYCFNECEGDITGLPGIENLIPGINTESEVKINTELFSEDIYIYLIEKDLEQFEKDNSDNPDVIMDKYYHFMELIDEDKYVIPFISGKSLIQKQMIRDYISEINNI